MNFFTLCAVADYLKNSLKSQSSIYDNNAMEFSCSGYELPPPTSGGERVNWMIVKLYVTQKTKNINMKRHSFFLLQSTITEHLRFINHTLASVDRQTRTNTYDVHAFTHEISYFKRGESEKGP